MLNPPPVRQMIHYFSNGMAPTSIPAWEVAPKGTPFGTTARGLPSWQVIFAPFLVGFTSTLGCGFRVQG